MDAAAAAATFVKFLITLQVLKRLLSLLVPLEKFPIQEISFYVNDLEFFSSCMRFIFPLSPVQNIFLLQIQKKFLVKIAHIIGKNTLINFLCHHISKKC